MVEITEQEDLDRACLERKRNVPGFSGSFALDDYGSGYSNELNLLELSPRYIKIDISIVRGIDTDRDKQQIVSTLWLTPTPAVCSSSPGIETEAQLRTVIGLERGPAAGLLPQPPRRSARPHCTGSAGGVRAGRSPPALLACN